MASGDVARVVSEGRFGHGVPGRVETLAEEAIGSGVVALRRGRLAAWLEVEKGGPDQGVVVRLSVFDLPAVESVVARMRELVDGLVACGELSL